MSQSLRIENFGQVFPKKFLFIRHAESRWNELGLWQGQCDSGLSVKGVEELPRLWEQTRLQLERVRWIFTSDLKRADLTARYLAEKTGARLWSSDHFRERHAGDWSGLSKNGMRSDWQKCVESIRDGNWLAKPPNGESRLEVMQRLLTGLLECQNLAHGGRPFALVSHLGVLRTLIPDAELGSACAGWVSLAQNGPNLIESLFWDPLQKCEDSVWARQAE